MRNQQKVEDVEAPRFKVEQDSLPVVPGQPGCEVVKRLRNEHKEPAPVVEPALRSLGIDLFARGIKKNGLFNNGRARGLGHWLFWKR